MFKYIPLPNSLFYFFVLLAGLNFVSCGQTPSVENRVKALQDLNPKDPFLKIYYDYLKTQGMAKTIFLYEEELIQKHMLKNTSPEAYSAYIKYLNTLDYTRFNQLCNSLKKEDLDKMLALPNFSKSPEYISYGKNAEKDLKNTSLAFKIYRSLLMSGTPDAQLSIKTVVEQNDVTAETQYFYLLLFMPAKQCAGH